MSYRMIRAAYPHRPTGIEELLLTPCDFGASEVESPAECLAPVVWFTGLCGSGKSTLCFALAETLKLRGVLVHVLDGDEMRRTVCADLGFTRADREENVHRMAKLAGMLAANGVTVLVAAITPYRSMRRSLREALDSYVEVYVNAPLAVCIARDPKGLYRRALKGEVRQFTGISDLYEEPDSPDIECATESMDVDSTVSELIRALDAVSAKREQVQAGHKKEQHVSK